MITNQVNIIMENKILKQTILIIGGCRSGKSRFALEHVNTNYAENKIFIATSQPFDEEMRQRIINHQKERGPEWTTVEAPYDLAEAVIEYGSKADVILADCLTLWTSNLILKNKTQNQMADYAEKLVKALNQTACSVIMVTNEVGTGIVPENKLARAFRDAAGMINQKIAGCVDRVILMVAGISVDVKQNLIKS
ncbi:Bifunctional adenosylcobalamin biosynthesis protein CobP [Candidatus Magnetomoraceae bacterium gMMP-15]